MDRLSLRGIVAGILLVGTAVVILGILLLPAKLADLDCGSWLDPTITEGDRETLDDLGPLVDDTDLAEAVETCDDRLALHGWLAVGAGCSGALVALAGFIAVPKRGGQVGQPPQYHHQGPPPGSHQA